MTDAFYTELAADAEDLITEFGRSISYRPGGTVEISPGEPWRGRQPAPAVTVTGVILDAKQADHNAWPQIEFTKKALISPNEITLTPSKGDKIEDEGVIYGVAEILPLKPGNIEVLYTLLISTER